MVKQKNIRALVSKDGRLSTPDFLDFKEAIAQHPEKEVDIIVRRRKRTSKQNRTIHWALNIFSKGLMEIGYKIEMEDLKYELKQKGFFGWVEYETNEGTKRRPKDTHEQSTDEGAESFDRIQLSAKQYGIIVPDPNPDR